MRNHQRDTDFVSGLYIDYYVPSDSLNKLNFFFEVYNNSHNMDYTLGVSVTVLIVHEKQPLQELYFHEAWSMYIKALVLDRKHPQFFRL